MIRIEESTVISRPVAEVFEFAANPGNQVLWAAAVKESKQTSEGPVGVGTTYSQVTELLGRRAEGDYEVTEYEPNRRFSTRTTSGPLELHSIITFKAVEGGTEVTLEGEAEVAGFFRLAEPIIARITKRQVASDVGTLTDLLEAQA